MTKIEIFANLTEIEIFSKILTKIKILENLGVKSIFWARSTFFDTPDHSILLNKLEYYGVKDNASHWFGRYLKGRYQYVDMEGVRSEISHIKTGVPQGSILGPNSFHFICQWYAYHFRKIYIYYIYRRHYSHLSVGLTIFRPWAHNRLNITGNWQRILT